MFRRKLVLAVVLAIGFMTTAVPRADANIFVTGTCVLKIAFNFTGTVGPGATTSPNFSMTVTNGPVDFSPDAATGWSGTQPCSVSSTLTLPETGRNTFFQSAIGGSSLWNCAVTVAGGTFTQSWTTRAGQPDPPQADMTFQLSGVWGSWELAYLSTTTSPLVEGAIHLVPDPSFPTEASNCATKGVGTIHTIGVEVFNDPDLSSI